MTVSIDELCERLDVRKVLPSEYRRFIRRVERKGASMEEQARMFDGHALPPTQVMAPLISERLSGAETVVELGFGTGFRLLYYALNRHTTQFVAVDNNPLVREVVVDRMDRLGVRNVRLETRDMFELPLEPRKFSCVLAIDCIPETLPPYLKGRITYQQFLAANQIRFSQMVDGSKSPSFYTTVDYAGFKPEYQTAMERWVQEGGLKRVEAVPFEWKKREEPTKRGTLLVASSG